MAYHFIGIRPNELSSERHYFTPQFVATIYRSFFSTLPRSYDINLRLRTRHLMDSGRNFPGRCRCCSIAKLMSQLFISFVAEFIFSACSL